MSDSLSDNPTKLSDSCRTAGTKPQVRPSTAPGPRACEPKLLLDPLLLLLLLLLLLPQALPLLLPPRALTLVSLVVENPIRSWRG